ncbi:succinate dehydrogenase cytochrome b560 subunit, mitochondrial-like [Sycon ciliatum]|uniref:succinate dehydrogenase cytochrome b560 subunit, mitochondrial-like n=1 Tax=Sycon ciliatum TaxID=27933 RepID=UPI0020ABC1BB|eukprot:scpid96851/ scgid28873/ Succinate dehydrogenase cytochrome b560 subunit, mitochondrial; Integral membrane protein CII-3; QPs-1; Succinate dehydrogenase complex subunit C
MASSLFLRRALSQAPLCGRASVPVLVRGQTSAPEDFFKKNEELKRPMSPHVTIYTPQWTWTLSIAHRGTGVGLACGIYAAAAATFTTAGSFEAALAGTTISPLIGSLAKLAISFPFVYHTANGIRHLNWDRGHGFEIKTLERQGQMVLGGSLIASALIAAIL